MRKTTMKIFSWVVLASVLAAMVYSWPFREARAVSLPAPILVVVNDGYTVNPFGRYLGEILRAEGLNAFTVMDISLVTSSELGQHSLVVLAETSLTSAQATMLTSYVNGGGRLLAMRPNGQIASLFGLGAGAGSLSNGYVTINTAANWIGGVPGGGLSGVALQIHGAADQYNLQAGAVMLATLYSNRTTATGYAGVVGGASGRTAAFTYDLARNVVYTRQGNPANGGVDVDGDGVLRTIDLFQTVGGGAPWVDREVIPVPQADEQQRLFARLVRQMVGGDRPLPQLWYFAGSEKTVLVITGDAHANPTSYYQAEINALNTYGAKATFYMGIASEPTDATMQSWRGQGYGFGIHPYAYHPDAYPPFNITNLTQGYDVYDSWWSMTFTSPKSRTVRNHQLAWLGWTDAAELAVAHGIALDTDFYHWGTWLRKPDGTWAHGYITGSGQAMKFVRADGVVVNDYQLLTELVDEQLITGAGAGNENLDTNGAVAVSKQLIDASQAGDYAALMTQFHVDYFSFTQGWATGTLDYARSLGIPRWNADMYLAFTETRHDASYTDINWDGGTRTLTFGLTAGNGTPAGLTTMLPRYYNGLEVASVSVDGAPATMVAQAVNGMDMVFVHTTAGTHSFSAVYQPVSGLPTPTNTATPTATASTLATATPTATAAASLPTDTPTSTATAANAPLTLTQTSFADFSAICALPVNVSASDVNGGSLVLSGALRDTYDSASLDPTRWSFGSWSGGVYAPTVAAGVLTLPGGGWVRSLSTYTHATFDAAATFGAGAWQHIGFGSDGFVDNRYFIFSTLSGDGNLYARVNNNTTEQNLNLGPIPAGQHRYRVVWQALDAANDQIQFYIDGVLKAQMNVPNTGAANLYAYLSNNGTANLAVDTAEVAPPYLTGGTYTSCIFDAGLNNAWTSVQWDAVLNAGSALQVETRSAPDGSTWSAWSTVALSGSPVANPDRYVQYRLTLSTTDASTTPVINAITFTYGAAAITPPTATATAAPALPTDTPTATAAPALPTDTPTATALPALPTDTPTATATATTAPALPTATPTSTPLPVLSTGFISPAANAPVTTSSGDNNGYEVTPGNAYANDGLYAVDVNSGTGTSTSCTNVRKDRHLFYNYSFNLTGATAIQGIAVTLVGKADSTSGSPKYCVELSWDGGATWTAARSTGTLRTTDTTFTLGSAVDTWGRTWTPAELASTTFRLRITDVASSTARDFSLNWVAVNVTYR